MEKHVLVPDNHKNPINTDNYRFLLEILKNLTKSPLSTPKMHIIQSKLKYKRKIMFSNITPYICILINLFIINLFIIIF